MQPWEKWLNLFCAPISLYAKGKQITCPLQGALNEIIIRALNLGGAQKCQLPCLCFTHFYPYWSWPYYIFETHIWVCTDIVQPSITHYCVPYLYFLSQLPPHRWVLVQVEMAHWVYRIYSQRDHQEISRQHFCTYYMANGPWVSQSQGSYLLREHMTWS